MKFKCQLNPEREEIHIPKDAKVASIMIGSLAANASYDYLIFLLNNNYDKIFVFGGVNAELSQKINNYLNRIPNTLRSEYQQRIVCLGNQSDVEIAPIMTRSDCVVIRGGGLSVMEQMALPVRPEKAIFIHHQDRGDRAELTSGLPWEDGNTDGLLDHFRNQSVFARKTTPSRFNSDILKVQDFYQLRGQLLQSSEVNEHATYQGITRLFSDELTTGDITSIPHQTRIVVSQQKKASFVQRLGF